ncbi:2-hydroxycarboxylate transporter family protein [Pseudomonas matsuisoli]|uniref:Citrate-sodium symporter n=1 Tax=Pseudomonas matsuisoli TaxID=1515666 RepID=A0A917PR02_9PSED|nr:2-hydroxycarboxylate transporter family protein [Pseudomonas matsuisoli]GGJ87941.1 citrate-sodium symporter [Pseudomonas matsuisoli]
MQNAKSIDNTDGIVSADLARQPLFWRLFDIKISFIPLPIYLLLLVMVAGLLVTDKLKTDLPMMVAVIGLGGATCAEIGKRLPFFGKIGGAAIVSAFLPSYLVSIGWVPTAIIEPITVFTKSSNFIYLFVSSVVVGSIFTMDRDLIIKGFAKIFVPLLIGSVLALVAGVGVGMLCGMELRQVLFFVIVPVMGGGLGEGAIPLSVGYGEILGVDSGKILAQLLPVILLGNLCAILACGALDLVGKRFPSLTGNGRLQLAESVDVAPAKEKEKEQSFSAETVNYVIAAGMCAIALYLTGVILHALFGLPGPVCMLFIAVLLKLLKAVPTTLEEGARVLFKFFTTCVTYPLLFANSIAVTHWSELTAALHVGNLLTIATAVLVLVATGFVMARRMGLYPIEAGIVNGCHSGLGGTGDIAILTAANRMQLLPYAQISTRIGGAITVMLALLILARLGPV